MQKLYRGAIGSLISRRSALAEELGKKMGEIDVEGEELKAELLQIAPAALQAWLKEHVVEALFKYGKFYITINFGEEGFGDSHDVEQQLNALNKKWKRVVVVELGMGQSRKVEVSFKVLL